MLTRIVWYMYHWAHRWYVYKMSLEERDKYLYLSGNANRLPVGVAETGMNVCG